MEKKKNVKSDWSTIHSELGMLDSSSESSEQRVVDSVPESSISDFKADEVHREIVQETDSAEFISDEQDRSEEPAPQKKSGEGKKTLFGRFPKINLFSSPSKTLFDETGEGTKNSSLIGKSFTSKTMEKAKSLPTRTVRDEAETKPSVPPTEPVPSPAPQRTATTISDPWTQIASQVGSLATDPEDEKPRETRKKSDRISNEPVEPPTPQPFAEGSEEFGFGKRREKRQENRREKSVDQSFEKSKKSSPSPAPREKTEHPAEGGKDVRPQRGRRTLPSMFDDAEPMETNESRALKKLIETPPATHDEAAKRLSSIFDEDRDESFGRGIIDERAADSPDQSERRNDWKGRRRGARAGFNDKNPPSGRSRNESEDGARSVPTESDFDEKEPKSTRPPRTERGGRGARFAERGEKASSERSPEPIRNDAAPDWEIPEESTWDIEEESKPVERGPRRRSSRRFEADAANTDRPKPSRPIRDEELGGEGQESAVREEEFDFAQLHKNIPSWDDAVAVIVEGNIAKRGQRSPDQRRGRR